MQKTRQQIPTTMEEPESVHQGVLDAKGRRRSPWTWVPTSYYAEGLPYIIVNVVSVIMYQRMGVSNKDIAFFTSWLNLPWMLKPIWSPLVDLVKTKRWWMIFMQMFLAAGLGLVAFAIPMEGWFRWTMLVFWGMAFCSATHDVACDGFYMMGLSKHQQAWFVGVRNTFYRLAMLTGTGLLVIFAGYIESHTGLDAIDLNIQAKASTTANALPAKFAVPTLDVTPEINIMSQAVVREEGPVRIVVSGQSESMFVPIQDLKTTDSKTILANVKKWNLAQGQAPLQQASRKEKGFLGRAWSKNVSEPLGKWLKASFAPKPPAERETTGNIELLQFHLSAPPEQGKEVVVRFGRTSGSKSVNLQEGTRITFTDQNWNKPAIAAIQLDASLKTEDAAEFRATAGNIRLSWIITFFILCALFIGLVLYHSLFLPHPLEDKPGHEKVGGGGGASVGVYVREILSVFGSFFQKRGIVLMLLFLLLYRFGEAQMLKLAQPFMLDSQENGGLNMTTAQVGTAYGIVGLISLMLGGVFGGFAAARDGLKKWLWPMAIAIHAPDLVFVYLSQLRPDSFFIINVCIGIEQFGYGFGYTASALYLIYCAEGKHKTVHFAIGTGIVAMGLMIPGMMSGWIQECIGYQAFFIWVLFATVPGFATLPFIPLDPSFGKKEHKEAA